MSEPQHVWKKEAIEKYAKVLEKRSKRIYLPFAKKIAENVNSEKELVIVDLSTGPGFLSIELSKLLPAATIVGVDPSTEMLQIAEKYAEKAGIAFETKVGKAEKIPVESDSVDVVVNLHSLHEWENPKKGFSEIFRVLKPGGRLMLEDFNKDHPKWKLWLMGLFISIMAGRRTAKGYLGSYKTAFTLEEVVDLLHEAGFDDIQGEGKGSEIFVQALK